MSGKKQIKKKKDVIGRMRIINVTLLVLVIVLASMLVGWYVRPNVHTWPAPGQSSASITSTVSSGGDLTASPAVNLTAVESEVLPAQGITLPARWGDSVQKLIASGALNETSLEQIVTQGGQSITPEELRVLNGTSTDNITLNSTNTAFVLDVLWAIGINNNNTIISNGSLTRFGNPDQFASTGGYAPLGTLHLSGMNLVNLNASEQEIAAYVAGSTYRPCCDNPTSFPDCNHGAAALGLIELMASQGNNATTIFDGVRAFSSFQFPQQYMEIGVFLAARGTSFDAVPAAAVMDANVSSAAGIANISNYLKANNVTLGSGSGKSGCGA